MYTSVYGAILSILEFFCIQIHSTVEDRLVLLTTVYILGVRFFVIVRRNQSRGKCYRPRLITSTSILIISDISKTENKTKDKQTVARETLGKKNRA